jgi:hypothetical protein
MALTNSLRQLAALAGSSGSALCSAGAAAPAASVLCRSFATQGPSFGRKDVVYNLNNTSDPEAEAAVKAFQREQFAAAAKGPAAAGKEEPEYELASQIERKYAAAQVVESGIQNVSVPLGWEKSGGVAAVKRYVAQLQDVGAQAGFATPAVELDYKVSAATSGAESLKDMLARLKPYTTPEYHTALIEAANAVEAETGAPVGVDGSSAGYKKFADKVKAMAQSQKLPWQMLVSVKQQMPGADDATSDKLSKEYQAWLQSAAVADAKAEIEGLQAEAVRLLDTQLSKSAEAVRKEQLSALAAVNRKLEAAKGTAWADMYRKDMAFTAWFDESVAASPAAGPKTAAA